MKEPGIKIGKEGVGIYWFINTDAAKNLTAARHRMREFRALGFTEVWIAARYLEDPANPANPLLGPLYEQFLRTVADEADHLGLHIIPFLVPCGFGEMSTPKYDQVLISAATITGGEAMLDLGLVPPHWVEALVPRDIYGWRTQPTDLSSRTIDAGSVRPLNIPADQIRLHRNDKGILTARVRAEQAAKADEICIVFQGRPGTPVPGLHQCAPDVTHPASTRLLENIVQQHENVLRARPCYTGLAFDEPNIGDTSNDPIRKRERERRFYWSDSVATAVRERKGIDLAAQLFLLARPDTSLGFAARVAYFETIQDCLIDAFARAMQHASVPLLGTHDWSGDRDRALYNTFDQLDFARARTFAATDISGIQADFDYAPSEALHAFTQKESTDKPRAMLMTDHFREPVDLDYLLYTCERHAALGVDYVLLHAFGEITKDPPLWTRTESWVAYREPRALELWTARMKQLSALSVFQSRPNVLVVFPRLARLVHCGDRYVTREWDRVMFSLFRAHYAPMTISQREFDAIRFDGGRAAVRGVEFHSIVFPCFAGLDDAQMDRLASFHRAGGHVLFTKSNYVFASGDGRPSPKVRKAFEALLGISTPPTVRRFKEGEQVSFGRHTYAARRLPDGASEYDDSCLDFGGRLILESRSPSGGRALLAGFEASALSCTEEMHRMHDTDMVRFLDSVLEPVAFRAFSCADLAGQEDYDLLGLVREYDGELLFSAHRHHARASVVRVGRSVVYIPPDPPRRRDLGCNVFVRHVEEAAHVICNPFPSLLRELDLGESIARIATMDGKSWWVHFDGSVLRIALAPGQDLRYAAIEFGPHDESLPRDLKARAGSILEARVPKDDPGRLIVRVSGPEKVDVRASLNPVHGTNISARCTTSGKPATVRARKQKGRLLVEGEFEIIPTLENDLVFQQSE